jgi:chemotaxis protein MotB
MKRTVKKLILTFSISIIALLAISCVSSKKFKMSVAENYRLNSVISEFQKDTLSRAQNFNHLQDQYNRLVSERDKLAGEYDVLKKTYDSYVSSALSTTERLNVALRNQQEELKRKEAMLEERERKLQEFQRIVAKQDSITSMINQIVKNALIGFKPEELTVELKNGRIYVSMTENLLFKSGSASVEKKGRDTLGLLAGALQKDDNISILVEGHTDNIPIKTSLYKDNWDLSVARATSIVRILSQENKVDPQRIVASGRGEYYPIEVNTSSEGRAKNRRTEIILVPNLDELYQLIMNI